MTTSHPYTEWQVSVPKQRSPPPSDPALRTKLFGSGDRSGVRKLPFLLFYVNVEIDIRTCRVSMLCIHDLHVYMYVEQHIIGILNKRYATVVSRLYVVILCLSRSQ